MKRSLALLMCLTASALPISRSSAAQEPGLSGSWHVGLHFGEIPTNGSFKPGLSVGYHFNDLVYFGVVAQIPDRIQRDGTSFNARAIGLDGLEESSETVSQRGYLQARIRPHRLAPFVSLGLVYNGRDTETIRFDARDRVIGDVGSDGSIIVTQARAAAVRPSLGFGYSYSIPGGVELFTEWAGWWMFGAPTPEVSFDAEGLSADGEALLRRRIVSEFTSSPFNTIHVFQVGVGYNW